MIYIIVTVFISLLLAYDYFSVFNEVFYIPIYAIMGIFACIVIFSIFIERKTNTNNSLKWQLFIVIYITALMGVFSLMGGKSVVGLSLTNKFVWIVIIISLMEMFFKWKNLDKQNI